MACLSRTTHRWIIFAGLLCWSGWMVFLLAFRIETTADGAPPAAAATTSKYAVFGYSLLGMHCMNQDFSEICILPPYNTMRAQVIDRSGEEPKIVTSGVDVKYSIPGNTTSVKKTNFWTHSKALFGVALKPDVGLAGTGLTGSMKSTGNGDFAVLGIPVTPMTDKGKIDPFQLSQIDLYVKKKFSATTNAVIPVSWEINCNLCHTTPGISVATDILRKHDKLHNTKLEAAKPVLCASCHADAALNAPGAKGVKSMSEAMHGAHASRMAAVASIGNTCYACHPGTSTNCQRDNHYSKGIACTDCHGDMKAVAQPTRKPWIDLPTCGGCHQKRKPNFDFEEPGKLFKDSRGHGGVFCAACHGPQHATGPAVTAPDNAQAIQKQGHAGTIDTCTVCHKTKPSDPFFHKRDD